MTQIQSGILLEHRRFALFIEAIVQGEFEVIRQGCKTFCQSLQTLQQRFPDAGLGATLAFGSDIWRDLLIHIQSLRHDVNFSLAQAALAAFGTAIRVEEETHSFRWVEDRDLSGFVDGTENPEGDARHEVAIIPDGQGDAGGSYVFVQRWEHNLKQLQRFSVEQQEQMIGRTKQDNQEIPAEQRQATSHLSRVDLKEEGKGLKILRQSMPYGSASGKHGLYFIAYCARLYNIEQQLLSMFGERDGKRDDMLRFTRAVSGSYFFAPSLDQLLAL